MRDYMSDEIKIEIPIPCDEDGFVHLKCNICGEKFMLETDDIEDDATIDIWCPNCGLKLTECWADDVMELAMRKTNNYIADVLNDFSKDLEKSFKNNKSIKFKADKPIKKDIELPIGRKITAFEMFYFKCCDQSAKISVQQIFTGCYCPFCGEMNIYED